MRVVMKNGDELVMSEYSWGVCMAGNADEWIVEYWEESGSEDSWDFFLVGDIRSIQATSGAESNAVSQVNNLLRMQNGEPV